MPIFTHLQEELPTHDYFRVDVQDRLPASEVERRRGIKAVLEAQHRRWETEEQHAWRAIAHPDTVSFLGINWSSIIPTLARYLGGSGQSVAFALLSELHLSTVRPSVANSYHVGPNTSTDHWLYGQYCRYQIYIKDFGAPRIHYRVPLLEACAILHEDPVLFSDARPNVVAKMLPQSTSDFSDVLGLSTPAVRLVMFPQTRYSFIEDEIFHALYPLSEEQARIMPYTLLQRFQGTHGYFNAFSAPFADVFVQNSYNGQTHEYYAAMYPVIEFEHLGEYESRKRSERFISSIQRQKPQDFPKLSQWRYSRRFDFAEESQLALIHGQVPPDRIQSGRALFEYQCGDLDTLSLDARQTTVLEGQEPNSSPPRVLVVDPLWLITFPQSSTICAFHNDKLESIVDDPFHGLWRGQEDLCSVGEALVRLVEKADRYMGTYEPIYRKRLAKLQFRIHTYVPTDRTLVKDLSDFVAELTILLDPLQAQINILKKWQTWHRDDFQLNHVHFFKAIKDREIHLDIIKRLQERGKESQDLLFRLVNIETAYLQSQLAQKMADETTLQVDLATRAERQNKSILIFTIITVIFVPLSFFTSYFGMNTTDMRNMRGDQSFFWSIAAPVSLIVISIAMIIAFRERWRHYLSNWRSHNGSTVAPLSDIESCSVSTKRD